VTKQSVPILFAPNCISPCLISNKKVALQLAKNSSLGLQKKFSDFYKWFARLYVYDKVDRRENS